MLVGAALGARIASPPSNTKEKFQQEKRFGMGRSDQSSESDEDDDSESGVDEGKNDRSKPSSTDGFSAFAPLSQPGRPPRKELLEDSLKCRWGTCSETFLTAYEARNHEQLHPLSHEDTSDSTGNLICRITGCGKTFADMRILRKHLAIHRPPQHACTVCGKRFHEVAKLKRHESVHTGEKRFPCPFPECGKVFNFKANLKTHERVHTGEKPFECPVAGCNKRFAQASNRNAHAKTHGRPGSTDNSVASNGEQSVSEDVDGKLIEDATKRQRSQNSPNLINLIGSRSDFGGLNRMAEAVAIASAPNSRPPSAPNTEERFKRANSAFEPIENINKRLKAGGRDGPGSLRKSASESRADIGGTPNPMKIPSHENLLSNMILMPAQYRSSSPFYLPFHQPAGTQIGNMSPRSMSLTPLPFQPIPMQVNSQGSNTVKSDRDKSTLQFNNSDSKPISTSPLQLTSMTPSSIASLFQAATPVCFIPTANKSTTSSSSGTGSFSDNSILLSGSLNNSLASHPSNLSQLWLPHTTDSERPGSLTPQFSTLLFSPDLPK